MNNKVAMVLVTAASLHLTTQVDAHEADSWEASDRIPLSDEDRERLRSKRYGAFELRIAPYFPQVDQEFDGATPFKDGFNSGPAWAFGFEADWQVIRIPHVGSIGPGVAWHYLSKNGTAEFTDPSIEEESAHPQRLWIMPMYAALVFRLDVLKRDLRVPFVPYAKLGFAVNLWNARDGGKVSEANGEVGKGMELGFNTHLGLMVHLNPLSQQGATDMDASTGINDAYLFAEWWYSNVNSFGTGMQVGTSTLCAGVAVEF